ncbi:ABC transporter ATP-binding protein [Myxococcota bacterium]
MAELLIHTNRLQKTFRHGFWMRKVEAVKGVSFEVHRGDIFGFLGPNGAGKTTTIKMLTGLIAPTGGSATLFGEALPSRKARSKIGFLPENPYVYPYLTPTEFVEMCGLLSGLKRKVARERARHALQQVGILYAADRPVRRLSKGMLQRTGLAAALVADPELLLLDEPMSGLDPVGRKEVRDLILGERNRGRTVFFSTHILGDVETLCDRVAILRKGEVVVSGALGELVRRDAQRTDVVVPDVPRLSDLFEETCRTEGHCIQRAGGRLVVTIEGLEKVSQVLRHAVDLGLLVAEVVPRTETLEALFMREAIDETGSSLRPPAA